MKEYFAHSPKEGIPAQPYAEHINNVLTRAQDYAAEVEPYAKYDGAVLQESATQAAAYHDLGKLGEENQEILRGEKEAQRLPKHHKDAGVAHCICSGGSAIPAAAAIAAHHGGFPNLPSELDKEEAAFRDLTLMEETDRKLTALEAIHHSLVSPVDFNGPGEIKGDNAVFLRMLLSCLVDADHTDSAINAGKYPAQETRILLKAEERLAALDRYVAGLSGDEPGERGKLRGEMYYVCRDADIQENISSCDSPVGSGKTTAIMAHLLAQAQKRGLRRIFVILPFTNIIQQSVNTYKKALVLSGESPEDVVAELHHRADFEDPSARHLTALWRAPIIVTTAVAFFETLASNTTSTLRRLHELPGSAVFIDESHAALPAKLIPLAWRWMNLYAKEWGCYWVLASGSLNRFWSIPEIAQEYYDVRIPEIVVDSLRSRLSAYECGRISYRSDLLLPKSIPDLTEWVCSFQGPRLVIVNTVQSAAVIADYFRKVCGRDRVEHLSSALTPIHREQTLERVKARLDDKDDTDWTLIATTCVEAGVNLSFRNGFRELCPLISLLQASGRVDREGRFGDSEMWTFELICDNLIKKNPGMEDGAEILRDYFNRGQKICPEISTEAIALEIRRHGTNDFKELLKYERELYFKTIMK